MDDLVLFVSLYTDTYPNGTTIERPPEGNTFSLTAADKHPAITSSPEIYLSHLESMGISAELSPSWWISDLQLAEELIREVPDFSFEVYSLQYDHTQDTNEPLASIDFQSGETIAWAQVTIQLSVNNGAYEVCSHPGQSIGSNCAISGGDDDDLWNVYESVTISEGTTDLCDGDICEVQLKIFDIKEDKQIYQSGIVSA